MKRLTPFSSVRRCVALILCLGLVSSPGFAQNGKRKQALPSVAVDARAIDAQQAQELMQRQRRGEKLSSDEERMLSRAMAERGKREAAIKGAQRKPPERLTALTDFGA